MKPGDDVVYVRCRCVYEGTEKAKPCESPEACGFHLFGVMEFRSVQKLGGLVVCRSDDGEFHVFDPHDVDTVEAVAARAVESAAVVG